MQDIIISTLSIQDKTAVYELLQTPAVMQYLGPRRVLNDSEALKWFNDALNTPSRFVFRLAKNNDLIGFCGVKEIDGKQDFGYFLRQKYWQQGFAKRMCNMSIDQLHQQSFDLAKLDIFIANDNIASLKIAASLGWQKMEATSNAFEQGWRFQIS
jgi:[ribosomal protein S5]-alanine N-acetyltransferase